MQITANTIYFFISYAVAFLVFGLIGKWYVWPSIRDRALKPALTPLLLYSCPWRWSRPARSSSSNTI
jgi:hypothetical protein